MYAAKTTIWAALGTAIGVLFFSFFGMMLAVVCAHNLSPLPFSQIPQL
jgi:hypothetical protein